MITGTQIAYYHLCHRKLWLQYHHINMENATGNVHIAEGNFIDETTYRQRAKKWTSLNLGHVKIDYFDPKNLIIREVKKSTKLEHVHIAQVKYYIYVMEARGVTGITGLIEYPKSKKTTEVAYTASDRSDIEKWLAEIVRICALEECPTLTKKTYCRSCAYLDFCFI